MPVIIETIAWTDGQRKVTVRAKGDKPQKATLLGYRLPPTEADDTAAWLESAWEDLEQFIKEHP